MKKVNEFPRTFSKDVADKQLVTTCANLVRRRISKCYFETQEIKYGSANETSFSKQYEKDTGNVV